MAMDTIKLANVDFWQYRL